jgi:hypothetical protein
VTKEADIGPLVSLGHVAACRLFSANVLEDDLNHLLRSKSNPSQLPIGWMRAKTNLGTEAKGKLAFEDCSFVAHRTDQTIAKRLP